MDKRPVAAATFLSALFGICKVITPACRAGEEASDGLRFARSTEQLGGEAVWLGRGARETPDVIGLGQTERDIVGFSQTERDVAGLGQADSEFASFGAATRRAEDDLHQLDRLSGNERLGDPELGGAPSRAEHDVPHPGNGDAHPEHEPPPTARGYEFLVQPRENPNELARDVIDDIAHHHPEAVVAKLEQLAGEGKLLTPEMHKKLLAAVARQSESVARRLDAVLEDRIPLNDSHTSVIAERGRLLSVRDISDVPRLSPSVPKLVRPAAVYLDKRLQNKWLQIAREGLLHEPGDQVAFWMQQRGVKLEQLRVDDIGELPDRLIDQASGLTAERTSGRLPDPTPDSSIPVYVIRPCDVDQNTTASSHAC